MSVNNFFKTLFGRVEAAAQLNNVSRYTHSDLFDDHHPIKEIHAEYLQHIFATDKNIPTLSPIPHWIKVALDQLSKKDYRRLSVPRLPSIIPRLMRSLRDPQASVKDYVSIINKDSGMSAAVLRVANSAMFKRVGEHNSNIEHAVAILGINGLKSVLSAAVMQPIIQRESPFFVGVSKHFWQHSLHTAVACEKVAAHRGLEEFQAYLLGLSHDIGMVILFNELCRQFKASYPDKKPYPPTIIAALLRYSGHFSALIVKDWELVDDIQIALTEQLNAIQTPPTTAMGELLFQVNLASELYALKDCKTLSEIHQLLADYHLPDDLFEHLDAVEVNI